MRFEVFRGMNERRDSPELLYLNRKINSRKLGDILKVYAQMSKVKEENGDDKFKKVKVAIIGSYTFSPLDRILEVKALKWGVELDIMLGDFDSYHGEILNSSSKLYQFEPEFVFIFPSHKLADNLGGINQTADQVFDQVTNNISQLTSIFSTLHSNLSSNIFVANFMPNYERGIGSIRNYLPGSSSNYVEQCNTSLVEQLPKGVKVFDLNYLSQRIGLENAYDYKGWYVSKQIGSMLLQMCIAEEIAFEINKSLNSMKKCLVCDLDNTLWGGVIGDDGLEGIDIGNTSPKGEAFKDFQSYIKSLKELGVILAVCSKNQIEAAQLPFKDHPEMVLRLEDFVSFKANWQPKSENIKKIAEEIGIGVDSLVFIDDNPAEIEIVNQYAPEVSTIYLGNNVSDYKAKLEDSGYFEPRALTSEDARKTSLYQQEVKRKELKSTFTDITAYLSSLEMQMTIQPFSNVDVPRISQLINKSNQFNLTTIRRTESEVLGLMSQESYIGFTIRLSDKFSDHGLISVCILKVEESTLEVETLVMSCRVLERQVEHAIHNHIVKVGLENKCTKLNALYLPTKKNALVKDLYKKLGYEIVSDTSEGTRYQMELDNPKTFETQINVDNNLVFSAI